MRVGVCRAGFFAGLEPEVEVAVMAALGQLEALGASLVEIEIPDLQAAREAGGPILSAEAAAYHERWLREVPEQYGEDVRRRAQAGAFLPAIYFIKAQQVRRRARAAFRKLFEKVDLLASATLPIPAP